MTFWAPFYPLSEYRASALSPVADEWAAVWCNPILAAKSAYFPPTLRSQFAFSQVRNFVGFNNGLALA